MVRKVRFQPTEVGGGKTCFAVGGKQWNKSWKDEECFGSSLDRGKGDFDFEKNLALFDKQALWDELNSQKPDTVKLVENRKKYR